MSPKHKGFITVTALMIFGLSMPFISNIWIKVTAINSIYTQVDMTPPKDVALVLGAAAYGPNSLSDVLMDRMDTAIELLNEKKVKKLVLSGAANEVEAMVNYAESNGVTKGQMIQDPNGFNTLASIQNLDKSKKGVAIVSQHFHLPRSLFYARYFGFDAVGVAADKREYAKISNFKKREVLANTKAFFDVFVTPELNPLVRGL